MLNVYPLNLMHYYAHFCLIGVESLSSFCEFSDLKKTYAECNILSKTEEEGRGILACIPLC